MRRLMVMGAAAAVSLSLAGCQTEPYGDAPGYMRPTGVEGQWMGTDGVAVSDFRHGTFTSHAVDTGNLLAQGTYRYTDSRDVLVTFTSLIRHQTIRANCTMVSPGQMNCTSSSGANFQLLRRGRG